MKTGAPLWYEALWRVALPFALARIWWRGRREPGYRSHVAERLGHFGAVPDTGGTVWIHAVSVGETRAAEPLVRALLEREPGLRIVLTHMTAAGRETGRALFGERVTQAFLPYDYGAAVERFYDWCRPRWGMVMETELWPNLILRGAARGIPVFLVNARLSAKSARGYGKAPALSRTMLAALAGVAAQTPEDAQRLAALGAEAPAVTGNVKFDLRVPADIDDRAAALRALFGAGRPVWVLGSTRDGEEAMVLDALARDPLPDAALIVIVPRHPQRFDEVVRLIEARGLRCMRRSANAPVPPEVRLVVGDSMGEMLAYYAAADLALIGGSLLPLGAQNLIEPLAVGTPVLVGPSTFNFAAAARAALDCGAAESVADATGAVRAAARLLADAGARARMAAAGTELVSAHRGATARTLAWIEARRAGPTAARG